jgi:hypothetical protein
MVNKVATTRSVALAAEALPDAYLKCRDLGHDWRLYYQKPNGRSIIRKLFCPSCKTNRKMKINRYGEVVANSYDYDKDYQIKGLGRIQGRGKGILRVEAINRQPELDLSADFPELRNQLS